MCSLTHAHNLTCSDINVSGTPVKPLDPKHFHSLRLPLPPSAAHCSVHHSDVQKIPSQLIKFLLLVPLCASVCLYTACLNVCVYFSVCLCDKLQIIIIDNCFETFINNILRKINKSPVYDTSMMQADIVSTMDDSHLKTGFK